MFLEVYFSREKPNQSYISFAGIVDTEFQSIHFSFHLHEAEKVGGGGGKIKA